MRNPKTAVACKAQLALCCALAAGWLAPLAAAADTGGASLTVSARVLPYTRVEQLSTPGFVTVTAPDIERGFVDVETPLSFSVATNRAQGATVVMTTSSNYFEQAIVSGLGHPVALARGGGFLTIPHPGSGRQQTAVTLRFRLLLTKATPAGTHAWPIRVSAQTMEPATPVPYAFGMTPS